MLLRQIWQYARLKPVSWLDDQVCGCAYPRSLRRVSESGVSVVINLHERPHSPEVLRRSGLTGVHIAVHDFTQLSPGQLELGVAAVDKAVAAGHKAAVDCGDGVGRTGTLLA